MNYLRFYRGNKSLIINPSFQLFSFYHAVGSLWYEKRRRILGLLLYMGTRWRASKWGEC